MDLSRLAFPLLRRLDPESAHALTVWGLRRGFGPAQEKPDEPILRCRCWGLDFPNPIGIAAGFDKNGEVFDAMLRAGFGFAEVGTVTPRPQAGNPRPRMFRLREDAALINRMGFNNQGLDRVAARLSNRHGGVVGANIGRNKDAADAERDYASAAGRLAYLIAGSRALLDHEDVLLEVSAITPDGPLTWEGAVAMFAVCNAPTAGGGQPLAPFARIDDGWLDAFVVQARSALGLASVLLQIPGGAHLDDDRVVAFRARELSFRFARPTHVNADGEVSLRERARYRVLHRAATGL